MPFGTYGRLDSKESAKYTKRIEYAYVRYNGLAESYLAPEQTENGVGYAWLHFYTVHDS
jgi:hypothetical protein